MAKVIMTSQQLVDRLKVLAARKTYYKNKYPDNLCYVHTDGRTSADCVNLLKALFNGYDVYNQTPGYYQRNLTNTGDCTEYGLLKQCSDISSDFKILKDTEPRVLYMSGHIGCYIGTCEVNGKIYNVIECTASWGGGILYSYVNEKGERYNHKNGTRNGKWKQHGKATPWVDYPKEAKPKVDYSKYPTLQMKIDPKTKAYLTRGEYVKIMQKLLKAKGCDPNGIDGIFGKDTKSALKKFQRTNTDINGNKLVVDCICGQKTWGSLYK